MTNEEQRMIGGIIARLDTIEERQEQIRSENRTDHALLFEKINSISIDGCAKGKQHSVTIQELKEQPTKMVAMGSALASIIAAGAAIIMGIFRH